MTFAFTPNKPTANGEFTFTPTDEWFAYIAAPGTNPVKMRDLGNGKVAVTLSMRYDYGPYQAIGVTDPTYRTHIDKVLIRALPESEDLDYLDEGMNLGTMFNGGVTYKVFA